MLGSPGLLRKELEIQGGNISIPNQKTGAYTGSPAEPRSSWARARGCHPRQRHVRDLGSCRRFQNLPQDTSRDITTTANGDHQVGTELLQDGIGRLLAQLVHLVVGNVKLLDHFGGGMEMCKWKVGEEGRKMGEKLDRIERKKQAWQAQGDEKKPRRIRSVEVLKRQKFFPKCDLFFPPAPFFLALFLFFFFFFCSLGAYRVGRGVALIFGGGEHPGTLFPLLFPFPAKTETLNEVL